MEIKDRIKTIRQSAGLSQQDFADKLMVKKVLVAHWETGRSNPRLENLTTICETFNVTADYVLFGKALKEAEPLEKSDPLEKRIEDLRNLVALNSARAAQERLELTIQNKTLLLLMEHFYAEVAGRTEVEISNLTNNIYADVRQELTT